MRIMKLLLCIITMTISSVTYAQYYAEAGLHHQSVKSKYGGYKESHMTPKFTFGYQFSPYFSSDIFIFAHKFTDQIVEEDEYNSIYNNKSELRINPIIGLSLKPIWPVNEKINVYGNVGFALTYIKEKDTGYAGTSESFVHGLDPFLGVGGQYFINKNVYINAEYAVHQRNFFDGRFDFSTLGVNLGYRF